METIGEYMTWLHRECDKHFAMAETAAGNARWEQSAISFGNFCRAIEQHFVAEENWLFPAFEERAGGTAGPVVVMRSEHARMRELIGAMTAAMQAGDAAEYLGQGETLALFMQQHNIKEENVLYPMIDKVLAEDRDDMLDAVRRLQPAQD